MRSGVRRTRSASIADSEGCGHSPVASWRARRSSGGRVACMATRRLPHPRARVHAGEGRHGPRRRPIQSRHGAGTRPRRQPAHVRRRKVGRGLERRDLRDPQPRHRGADRPRARRDRRRHAARHPRHPAGVCGLIPTWNFPLFVTVQKLGPALATGCTMVFKPSPYGPLINLFLAEIVAEADLPPGVVNFVTGQSNAIAETLVSDPRIDKVSFTGSVATGKKIMEAAAKTLKRVHLELGGKSVAIFLDTDNLDLIAPQAASPTFFHAGQGCAMNTRVLIPREAHDTLVQKMVDFVQGMVKVGDPADPGTFLGPVIREERRQKIEEYIESGKREGAVLAHGGGRPKDLRRGYFLEPTIFCAVPNRIRIAQEEIFGPVVSVIPFTDEDEAIRIANDSTYGLGGMVLTRDTARAIALAKRIRTGVVWINNGINFLDAPFGGVKESGIGREGGRFGMEEYTEMQQIVWKA